MIAEAGEVCPVCDESFANRRTLSERTGVRMDVSEYDTLHVHAERKSTGSLNNAGVYRYVGYFHE